MADWLLRLYAYRTFLNVDRRVVSLGKPSFWLLEWFGAVVSIHLNFWTVQCSAKSCKLVNRTFMYANRKWCYIILNCYMLTVAALAIDKAGPRPCHFRPGPASGPATRPGSQKSKISTEKNSIYLIKWFACYIWECTTEQRLLWDDVSLVSSCVYLCWVAWWWALVTGKHK